MKSTITLERLKNASELLYNHYRLNADFFVNCHNKATALYEVDFPCSRDDVRECFTGMIVGMAGYDRLDKFKDDDTVIDALWLVMSICCQSIPEIPDTRDEYFNNIFQELSYLDDDSFMEYYSIHKLEMIDCFYKAKAREDLLNLYIYHKEKPQDIPTEITLKYGKGKSVRLTNKDNWFEKVLLSNHLTKYLPDINSVEDAKSALNVIRHTGRGLTHPYIYHFIYGTYSMFCELQDTTTATAAFCWLVRNLMTKMSYPLSYTDRKTGEKIGIDSEYVRKMISKIKRTPEKYRISLGSQSVSLDDLKHYSLGIYANML